ncbi:hypothetical protein [Salipiger abyssi]|uniref:Uncharacterized protein n=1 Tax=Salipiger abyssi TaxID=1250539 RepID=A0A1P8UUM9_9RHOB|nr:hypothetical protein [Salipiger abyssi]APZ53107.1 hypothetical protein Ga0080574_TMP2773 [Salipiger abyssi]
MPLYHSNDAEWLASLRTRNVDDLTNGEMRCIAQMVRDRDLVHVDDELARQEMADLVIDARATAAAREYLAYLRKPKSTWRAS